MRTLSGSGQYRTAASVQTAVQVVSMHKRRQGWSDDVTRARWISTRRATGLEVRKTTPVLGPRGSHDRLFELLSDRFLARSYLRLQPANGSVLVSQGPVMDTTSGRPRTNSQLSFPIVSLLLFRGIEKRHMIHVTRGAYPFPYASGYPLPTTRPLQLLLVLRSRACGKR